MQIGDRSNSSAKNCEVQNHQKSTGEKCPKKSALKKGQTWKWVEKITNETDLKFEREREVYILRPTERVYQNWPRDVQKKKTLASIIHELKI